MGKYYGKSRYEVMPLLQQRYNLSDKDIKHLTDLWYEYGMRATPVTKDCSPANHYFIQGIIEHLSVQWETWSPTMTSRLKEIIRKEFPQLMVEDNTFSID